MRPTRTFRTIRGSNAKYKVAFYTTKERRDAAGQRDADKDGQNVLLEEWTPELDAHNDINQGWGCDGVARPTKKKRRMIVALTVPENVDSSELATIVDLYFARIDPEPWDVDPCVWPDREAFVNDVKDDHPETRLKEED